MRIEHGRGDNPRPSLFICSPSYSGEFDHRFVISLLQTCKLLDKKGIGYTVYFSVYDSLVARTRNDLADRFMKSDCTHCLMIDADQGWQPEAVVKMLELDKPFLTGAVPGRKPDEEVYALKIHTNPDRTPRVNNEGLIACAANGVAFGMIKREVFDKLSKPTLHNPFPYFQHRYFDNGDHYGEDTFFVDSWIKDGGEVWIYPDISFDHAGVKGNYHEFLLRQPKPVKNDVMADLDRIIKGVA